MRWRLCVVFALAVFPCAASAGTQSYTTPGTYSFTVPAHSSLSVQVWGGGGGGAVGGQEYSCGSNGGSGSVSSFSTVMANGGAGGVRGGCGNYTGGAGGAGGTASGGSTNTTGNTGSQGDAWYFTNNGGNGASAPSGGSGGTGGISWVGNGTDGTAPGAGGGGGGGALGGSGGGGGGSGGYAIRTYSSGILTPGSSVTVRVGAGGAGSNDYSPGYAMGGNGASGRVIITWVDAVAASCAVTADTNPLSYGQTTTLRWSSADATTFYINGIGYVTPNTSGSTTVGPLSTADYGGTVIGAGGNGSCAFTLTVSAPASCTFNGSSVAHGASVTAYSAATVPYGGSCSSQTRTCSNGTLSGTYQYASCAVGPACVLSLAPSSIVQGQTSTVTLSSQNATSCTGTNISLGGVTSGAFSVSPSQSVTYGASCSGPGGSAQCTGAMLSVSCTPSWSCTGAGGQTITETDASCNTIDVTTCVAPHFCSEGASSCISADVSGSLNASPRFVRSGETATVSWSTTDAESCTVTGNGDTWTGTSGSETTSSIRGFAAYAIVCDGHDADTTQDDFSRSAYISLIPSWRER